MTEKYLSGFGNHFSTEAKAGALPTRGNNPQRPPFGLYAEQVSGSAFTAPRASNKRSWLYRIQPSVTHSPFIEIDRKLIRSAPFDEVPANPNRMRWNPIQEVAKSDFIEGWVTMAGNGSTSMHHGIAIHLYSAHRNMESFFYNSDGELLIVPYSGRLHIKTEMGHLLIEPLEIAVIPKGIKFQVELPDGTSKGYVGENYGMPFELPYLGPIGSNGLANSQDFKTPEAHFEEKKGSFKLITKFQGRLWKADIDHSPLDVVAWHGNYAPYKYDLRKFNTMNTVSYDHPDPSIFTVLTSPSAVPGTANVDFVIFPPRWMVAEDTFRPPYYHRNMMSEFMGLITGQYDAKEEGFLPGGSSLHNCMSAHGPDAKTFAQASQAELSPHKIKNSMAFMFESFSVYHPTEYAMKAASKGGLLQPDYDECWKGLPPFSKQS